MNESSERLGNPGGFRGRLHLFSPSERVKMKDFVELKMEHMLDVKLKKWDEDECNDYPGNVSERLLESKSDYHMPCFLLGSN